MQSPLQGGFTFSVDSCHGLLERELCPLEGRTCSYLLSHLSNPYFTLFEFGQSGSTTDSWAETAQLDEGVGEESEASGSERAK